MKANFESGHAQNAASSKDIVHAALELGNKYAPSLERLKVGALQTLIKNGDEAMKEVENRRVEYLAAAKSRALLYDTFNSVMSRLNVAMRWLDVAPHTAKHVKSNMAKMRGRRQNEVKPLTDAEKAAGMVEPRTVSVSHRGFVKRSQYGNSILTLLEHDPNFNVQEPDLQVAALRKLLADMETASEAVSKARAAYASAMIDRDHLFYAPKDGLVDVSKAVKNYICSTFGLQSMEYRKVKSLTLRSHQVRGVKLVSRSHELSKAA